MGLEHEPSSEPFHSSHLPGECGTHETVKDLAFRQKYSTPFKVLPFRSEAGELSRRQGLALPHSGIVSVRLPRKRNAISNGARPVHLIITTIKWIWTSRLSAKNSLSLPHSGCQIDFTPKVDLTRKVDGCAPKPICTHSVLTHTHSHSFALTRYSLAFTWYSLALTRTHSALTRTHSHSLGGRSISL